MLYLQGLLINAELQSKNGCHLFITCAGSASLEYFQSSWMASTELLVKYHLLQDSGHVNFMCAQI